MRLARAAQLAAVAAFSVFNSAISAELAAEASFGGNSIKLYTDPLSYEISMDGAVLVPQTPIGLCLDGKCVAKDARCLGVQTAEFPSAFVETPVYKKGRVDLARQEKTADFGDFAVRLAARADGVAYRFELKKPGIVTCEKADLTIPASSRCWFNRNGRKGLGNEETVPEFADAAALASDAEKAYYLPFVYSAGGKTVAVVDTGVRDYPVWNFGDVEQTGSGVRLKSIFAKYPRKTVHCANTGGWKGRVDLPSGGRWVEVRETEDYIAKAEAPRALPWRAFALADSPSKLCEADISYALADPAAEDADFSWVKPGKVAWDWWNAFDNKGDPQGCTTETYVRFIDFAAKTGVEYVIFDEGWSAKLDIWKYSPAVDVPYLIDYAGKKGVGIILWMAWAQICGDEERVAEHFSKLGAKGFKVDFMDRADAQIAVFLEKFAAACAKHKMVVDYHGAYRPVGLQRAWPNVLNFEGIHGLETMKWGKIDKDMCMNDVACFFIRMTAGPMDYTPGAMDNYPVGAYKGTMTNPGSVGTRCRQIALMSLYEAPLQMLSDSPTKYEKNMECFSFMSKTPVVWDATIGLGGCPESFAAVARKSKDGAWYASGITNRDARDFVLDTAAFLEPGGWNMEVFRDAGDKPEDVCKYAHETVKVESGEKIPLHMAPGGGFAIRFSR